MYLNITDSETADNKSSSGNLVHYLDKENSSDLERHPELWFNQGSGGISSHAVKQALDRNIAKLSKTDSKFFLVNISPSQKEIAFLKGKYGEDGAKEHLKAYAASVMDEYALNFQRPGVESNKDLLWFGKLENYRYYSYKDQEVKQGLKKRGERKPGEQMHIQVIVSRKDITNRIKLSPMNKSRGKNAVHSKKMGQFDRSAFKSSGERIFDEKFDFKRGLKETFRYANTRKKGSLEQRMALHAENRDREKQRFRPNEKKHQTQYRKSALGQQPFKSQPYAPVDSLFLKLALSDSGTDVAPSITRKRKRRKTKEEQQDQYLTL